jgi:Ni/Co efflux regulator RcnB
MMKNIFTSMALVALVATPVLAQTKDRPAQQPRAQASQTQTQDQQRQQQSAKRGNDVYDVRGQRVGSDPDASVRFQLENDPAQGD